MNEEHTERVALRLAEVYIDHVQRSGGAYSSGMRKMLVAKLRGAAKRIQPENQQSLAFVLWSGLYNRQVEIDEYCRRQAGEPSRLPDHPVLARIENWCAPSTQRLLVFREQRVALLRELFNPLADESWLSERLESISSHQEKFRDFRELLKPEYRERLSRDEMFVIFRALKWGCVECQASYYFYSVLVDRGFRRS